MEKKYVRFHGKVQPMVAWTMDYMDGKDKVNYDYIEYRGIRNVRDLFDMSINEDYYKPIIGKNLSQTINQLLFIFRMGLIILKS